MTDSAYAIGATVVKPKGYPFDGTIVALFENLNREARLVVESSVIPGLLHIFSPNQIELPSRNRFQVVEGEVYKHYKGTSYLVHRVVPNCTNVTAGQNEMMVLYESVDAEMDDAGWFARSEKEFLEFVHPDAPSNERESYFHHSNPDIARCDICVPRFVQLP